VNENKYCFFITDVNTDWDDLIVFDLETVSTIEEMRALKESAVPDLKYLDVRNSKYVAFAVNKKYPQFRIKSFRFRNAGNWRIYYNHEELDYVTIAHVLIDVLEELDLKGFVAHKFDFLLFLHVGYKLINQKGTLLLSIGKKKRYRLVDTLKIGKACGSTSLDELAKTFGVRGKNTDTAKTLQEYVVNDVLILTRIIEKFKKLGIEGTPTKTGRKYIYEVMIEKGMKSIYSSVDVPLDYIGGRVETFWHYAEKGNVFDANSLYPSVMAEFLFPAVTRENVRLDVAGNSFAEIVIEERNAEVLREISKEITPFKIKEAFENHWNDYHFLLHVKVNGVRERFKPFEDILLKYFPFSYVSYDNKRLFKFNPKAIYQVQGYEVFWLAFFDYEIVRARMFNVDKYVFSELYKELYYKRLLLKKRNDTRQLLLKIVMNSSYGIMGLRDTFVDFYTREKVIEELGKNEAYVEYVKNAVRFQRESEVYRNVVTNVNYLLFADGKNGAITGRKFSFFSVPLWATTITSHARFWLQCVILSLVLRGYKVFYCDTDSVFTDADYHVFKELGLLGEDMLQWKNEYEFRNAYFFAPKTYILTANGETKIKAKGIGKTVYRELVVQSSKNPYPRVMIKRIFNPTTVPKKIPTDEFESVYNENGLRFIDAFEEVLSKFGEDYPELYDKITQLVLTADV